MENTIKYEFGQLTDVGMIRQENEDNLLYARGVNGDLFVVADGMGGYVGGKFASTTAINTIEDIFINSNYINDPKILISNLIFQANKNIYNYALENIELNGMGTTIVLALICNDIVYYAHVGDSRLYLLREERLFRITKDHSRIQELIDSGAISYEDSHENEDSNIITRALGINPDVEIDIGEHPFELFEEDKILICSDGLHGLLKDEEIIEILIENIHPQEICQNLIQEANNKGGTDNITTQVINIIQKKPVEYQRPRITKQIQ